MAIEVAGYQPVAIDSATREVPMGDALEEVASTADEVAGEQHEVAAQARAIKRLRREGWTWEKVFDERSPSLLALLRSSARKIASEIRLLGAVVADEMAREGQTRRQIARRLGVSHQRVTAILHGAADPRPRDTE